MKIEGMMCVHCQKRVQKTLEAIAEVDEANVDFSAGTAGVKLNAEISNDVLKKAVEDQVYEVISVE